MFAVENYASRGTVSKMWRSSLSPGYTRSKPVGKPKLGTLLSVIDEILMMNQDAGEAAAYGQEDIRAAG